MVRFAEVFPDQEIVSALMTQLGWTHFIYLIALESDLKRRRAPGAWYGAIQYSFK